MRKYQDIATGEEVFIRRWNQDPHLWSPPEIPRSGNAWVWQAPHVLGSQEEAHHIWYGDRHEIGGSELAALHRVGIREIL